MAFIAAKSRAKAYEDLKEESRRAKSVASAAVAQLASSVTSDALLGFAYSLKQIDDKMTDLSATPGLGAYATSEEVNTPGYDVIAEYQAASTAIGNVISWVNTNFPADVNGYLLGWKIGPTQLEARVFPPAQTAPLLALCQLVVDSITE